MRYAGLKRGQVSPWICSTGTPYSSRSTTHPRQNGSTSMMPSAALPIEALALAMPGLGYVLWRFLASTFWRGVPAEPIYRHPPVPFLGIVDTGTDLSSTQCLPCVRRYHQTLPTFGPQRSSTSPSRAAPLLLNLYWLWPRQPGTNGWARRGGEFSLVDQLKSSLGANFSYCLFPCSTVVLGLPAR